MGAPGGPHAWASVAAAIEEFLSSRPRPVRVGDQYKVQVYIQEGKAAAAAAAAAAGAAGAAADGGGGGVRGVSWGGMKGAPRGPMGPMGGPQGPHEGLRIEEIEIKIMRIEGEKNDDIEFGLVAEETEKIISEEPIDREAFDSASEITYDDVGGLKKEVQLLREYVELPLRFPDVFKKVSRV
ncbi:Transitional endoplasmic reticulum ATPase, related [Eimeria mitis]|uniref:Transitional endoplasmic reticulum ATPase, related n=1 Tax=Eimeria mitis TaxID=44415 RepID=U6JWK6_9EIME|nr:Transitional endoplasmic reticulum ATPase, related [Eimeria mitis]CDJ27893.1 Transitional endoplasmic reticulum ATPase, related [Eimeria mitis]